MPREDEIEEENATPKYTQRKNVEGNCIKRKICESQKHNQLLNSIVLID